MATAELGAAQILDDCLNIKESTMRKTVPRNEWISTLEAFRDEEKAATRALDRLAAARRRLPCELVTSDYLFARSDGTLTLKDLFEGRDQLIVYHHMLKPADASPCSGCGMFADSVPNLAHLHARRTSLVMVSRAPIAEIEAFRSRMGWDIPWLESQDSFNEDFGITGGFGVNVFLKEDSSLYRTYFTNGRGVETLGSVWGLLDLTQYGRQEIWQDAPSGTPQSEPYDWWRLHDEY